MDMSTEKPEEIAELLYSLADLKEQIEEESKALQDYEEILRGDDTVTSWIKALKSSKGSLSDDADDSYAIYRRHEDKEMCLKRNEILKSIDALDKCLGARPQTKPVDESKIKVFTPLAIVLLGVAFISIILGIFFTWALIVVGVSILAISLGLIIYRANRPERAENLANKEYNEKYYSIAVSTHANSVKNLKDTLTKEYQDMIPLIKNNLIDIKDKRKIAIQRLNELEKEIENPRYNYKTIKSINAYELRAVAEILNNGRADTFKEAVNLFVKEDEELKHRNRVLKLEAARLELETVRAKAEARDRAERREREEEHYQTMEKQARRQTEIAEQIARKK